jgi:hypothetical protein
VGSLTISFDLEENHLLFLGGLLTVFCLFILSFLNPGNALIPFVIIDFMSWVGVGFLTISLDALVISTTAETERGKINKTVNGTVDIPAGKSVTVKTGILLGFGAISITAKVADEEQTATGTQLIIFSMVKNRGILPSHLFFYVTI